MVAAAGQQFFHALIRTHHITSRTKVAKLKAASKKLNCYVLLKSGSFPGLMYVESVSMDDTQRWVDVVHGLRYKDYQLLSPPVPAAAEALPSEHYGLLEEVDTAKQFAGEMETKNLLQWWRSTMSYDTK